MILQELSDNPGARKKSKRLGRGIGSGKGKTAGKGHKGQKARTGVSLLGLEGGQTKIYMRLPKRGFNSRHKDDIEIVNLATIQDFVSRKKLDPKKEINKEVLLALGIVKKKTSRVKLLCKFASDQVKEKLSLAVDLASKSAVQAVEKAGGKVALTETATGA